MNVWQQLDNMKAKFEDDMRIARAACESYKFVGLKVHDHGAWTARSAKNAKHSTKLNAPSAEELVAAMKRTFEAAEEAAQRARKVTE